MIVKPKVSLPAPFVSGVDENNNIDKNTLTENIVVMVPRYQSVSEGDLVKIYFGVHEKNYIITAANINRAILVEFLPTDISAGVYDVRYEVTDGAGNTVESVKLSLTVTEGSSPSAKPAAPFVEGASGDQLDLSSLTEGKLTVDIPSDNGNLQTGDGITVVISDGTTQHKSTHLVVQDVNPHHVVFSTSLFGAGIYQIYYIRNRNGVEQTSAVLTLHFLTQIKPLPLPIMPQAIDGVIALNELTEDVVVEIPVYSGVAVGDIIQIWVGGVKVTPHIVVQSTLKIHIQTISPEIINSGQQGVYYTVTRLDGSLLGSSPQLEVTFARKLFLSEAMLTGEIDGKLDIADLNTPYIEMVVPKWEGISRGDEIHGFIGNIEAVPHVVVKDILDHHTLHFDKEKFLPESYSVSYEVVPVNGQPSVISPKRQVQFVSTYIVTPEVQSVLDRINAGAKFSLLNDKGEHLVSQDYISHLNNVESPLCFGKGNAFVFYKSAGRFYAVDTHKPTPFLFAMYLTNPYYPKFYDGWIMVSNKDMEILGGDFYIDFEYAGKVNNKIFFVVKTSKGYWTFGRHVVDPTKNKYAEILFVGERESAVKVTVAFC
ncbi:hypothetical protein ASR74_21600 [Salmonella enterica]|uniref:Ig-like domain-containing protein n=1 Tax=Salmonella enterica TaxID=28901 RepID=A0A5U2CK22_SALER|nr:hypothetical protein [Salmonella enterica]EDX5597968.1 hypothetical protein [Salmonella enterica subsp. enterica serovar Saintpaul]EAS1904539.1 hypothetical protein [Salmonella enterica]EAX2903521.1 hypothetical protein [Salmonella enterica]EBD3888525.1 hypothetical protein [Salmonella enterica]EBO9650611.1 hypothetical protein [Salmonella enterica]